MLISDHEKRGPRHSEPQGTAGCPSINGTHEAVLSVLCEAGPENKQTRLRSSRLTQSQIREGVFSPVIILWWNPQTVLDAPIRVFWEMLSTLPEAEGTALCSSQSGVVQGLAKVEVFREHFNFA